MPKKLPHHPRLITKHPLPDGWPLGAPIIGSLAALAPHAANTAAPHAADRPGSLSAIGRWALLRRELDALRAWSEQRCTLAECRAFLRLPANERARRPPPLPAGWADGERWAITIRRLVDAALRALEAGEINAANTWLESAREHVRALTRRMQNDPPRSPRGRPNGPVYAQDDQELLRIVTKLIQLCHKKGLKPTQFRVAGWLKNRFEAMDAPDDEPDDTLRALLNQKSAQRTQRSTQSVQRYIQRLCKRLQLSWDEIVSRSLASL